MYATCYVLTMYCVRTESREGEEGVVDGERELHWQLRRHNGRDDKRALQQQLVTAPLRVLQALLQHIPAVLGTNFRRKDQRSSWNRSVPGGDEGEDQQEADEDETLKIVHRHPLCGEEDRPHEFTLLW